MPHTITHNAAMRIVELTAWGALTLFEVRAMFSQALQLATEQQSFLLLSDLRNVTNLGLSTIEIYDLPAIFAETAAKSGTSAVYFKRAIVITPKDTADARFSETVAVSQRHNARFFQDIDEARQWLLKS